jgi:putative spermidine/putrescine transport system substrate-binding protein
MKKRGIKNEEVNMLRSIMMTGVAALALGLAPATGSAQESITVTNYGGVTGTALQECVFDPFTKATGIRVTPEPGVSAVTLSKLQQQRDNPVIDVAWMDGGVSEIAEASGVLAPIDPGRVPNIANLAPQGVYKNAKGEIFALSGGYYAVGIIYNTKEVKTAPKSFKDLWGKEYAGLVTFPSPTNAMGIPFILTLAKAWGGSIDNTQPAIDQLKTLKVSSYFDTSGAAENAFQTGEVIIGAAYHYTASTLGDQGLPLAYAAPAEGAPAGDIRAHLVKGSKKLAQAEKFMNFLATKEPLQCVGERSFFGPPLKELSMSEKARKRMPWGENGSIANLVIFDWTQVNAKRAALTETFNREVAHK